VTAFDDLERGDIVWGTDPLSEKGHPRHVLGVRALLTQRLDYPRSMEGTDGTQ